MISVSLLIAVLLALSSFILTICLAVAAYKHSQQVYGLTCVAAIVLAILSSIILSSHFYSSAREDYWGKPIEPAQLNAQMIYRFKGQAQTQGGCVAVLENGKGEVTCVILSEPVKEGTQYVTPGITDVWQVVPPQGQQKKTSVFTLLSVDRSSSTQPASQPAEKSP